MRFKTLYVCIILIVFQLKLIAQTYVPDNNFEQALINLGYDTAPLDNFVPTANINTITNLDVSEQNISDLTGIEDFTSLISLDCSQNILTTLNVSQNSLLTELFIHDNLLTNIDVSNLTALKILWCYSNNLNTLNVINNTSLISLVCWNNNLSILNVTNNTALTVLVCEENNISNLDITQNTALNRLQCGNNTLNNLNLKENTNLTYLACENNQLTTLDISENKALKTVICSNNNFKTLDFSKNLNLSYLDCNTNELCTLNVKNGNNSAINFIDFSNNNFLNCVVVDNENADFSTWQPTNFNNYTNTVETCNVFVPVDELDDFIGTTYTLPTLTNGNYFTESEANGTPLSAGNVINQSQLIYIYNATVCDSNESSFYVFITDSDYYIPKYFTPNNDGSHDLWQIIDNTNSINTISIYNKYGKLIKFLAQGILEWDGTFKGNHLPTDDYWYVINFNTGEVLRGHFTLKR
ncbi:T9SS type B sorting domain-containing protein [Neotamlana laminarinivorans]|uniref:T9SS type B sorting domain-containing protein n=1 Tax=Neotamlana laminarinivorans TaxID=2883124 RepID=A0A9X1HZ53_9FLAO|nr:T9SS type B sorting domain-containing protein [Tamlana laminarinivorans]MCB4798261.1 T9SS type B sorting domain-containing protein [Tamlana laminarinivorans]